MCIIISKPAGVEIPRKSVLERCWYNNPDGGGYMYADGQTVTYKKGFMSFKAFWKSLKKCGDLTSVPLVIHFRISTHGGVNKANCHPFEVTTSTRRLTAERGCCNIAVAHNGVISMYSNAKGALSDTAQFTRDVLTRLCKKQTWYKDKSLRDIIAYCSGVSRLAIMSANGHVEHIGRWYTDNAGVMYSNEGYKESAYKYTYKSAYAPAVSRSFDAYSGDEKDYCDGCERADCLNCSYYYYMMDEMEYYS